MVEIERLVSGDLNKSIEQCVTLLMDVERKVHVLKNELAQTLNQLPNARPTSLYGYQGGFPTGQGVPTPFVAPFATGTPATPGFPETPMGRMPSFVPYWQGNWTPGWNTPWSYGYNYGTPFGIPRETIGHGVPYNTYPGILPGVGMPYGVPHQGFSGPSLQGFNPLHQGLPAVSGLPGYSYIW